MPNTTAYSFGDVILVPFPFTVDPESERECQVGNGNVQQLANRQKNLAAKVLPMKRDYLRPTECGSALPPF